MGYNNGEITAPVSVYDVQRTLGVSDNDVKSLCMKTQLINKWSRIKPVEPSPGQNIIEPLSLPATGILMSHTFKTIEEDWGVNIYDDNNQRVTGAIPITDLTQYGADSYQQVDGMNEHNSWKLRPVVSVGRLTDFAGYYHQAVPFLFTNYQYENEIYSQQSLVDFYIPFFLVNNEKSIPFSDMINWRIGGSGGLMLGDMYLCAVWDTSASLAERDQQGEVFSANTIRNSIGDDAIDIRIPIEAGELSGNLYNIYFCLSTRGQWSGTSLLPIPTGSMLLNHIQVRAKLVNLFVGMTLVKVGSVSGIGSSSLSSFDLSNESASFWTTTLADPDLFDVYGQQTPRNLYTASGNGVVLKITATVGTRDVPNFSASQVQQRLNTGTAISSAVQVIGQGSNCANYPSTSTTTFTLKANQTYTFYVVAIDNVADSVNEVQLSMSVINHIQEGMQAATPWMNVLQQN